MRRLAVAVVIVLILAADQETKSLARQHLRGRPARHFGAITLIYAVNRGAFLSLGENFSESMRTIVFDVIVAIGLAVAAFALFRSELHRGDDFALAAIIAGGVGNLIDRLRFAGRVSDFVYLSAGPLHTGVFNIADMAITFGVIWLMVSWMFSTRARIS
ncbi:MAG: signal peptidase II [Acidobacteriota bacterium]|nr:signal peptidase II [Acidobacteriota bacterium]